MAHANIFQCLMESSESEDSEDDETSNEEMVVARIEMTEKVEGLPCNVCTLSPSEDEGENNVMAGDHTEAITEMEKAVLIQLHTVDCDNSAESKLDDENIEIEVGKFLPVFPTDRATSYNQRFFSLKFFGRCFLCGCIGHSQAYCSLKYCSRCGKFGHSTLTCFADLSNSQQEWHPDT